MNLTRCAQGHFYDGEKYPSCPHCAGAVSYTHLLHMAFMLVTRTVSQGNRVSQSMRKSVVHIRGKKMVTGGSDQ